MVAILMQKRAWFFLCVWYLCVVVLAPFATAAASSQPSVPLPSVLRNLLAFRGRVTYSAFPSDSFAAQDAIAGVLTISGYRWTLEERGAHSVLHASSDDSWVQVGAQALHFDDPFQVSSLANAWAPTLADVVAERFSPSADAASWTTSSGIRLYVGSGGTAITGLADGASDIGYAFDDWTTVNGLMLPQSIVRLRAGAADRSFAIRDYTVQWAAVGAGAAAPSSLQPATHGAPPVSAYTTRLQPRFPWRQFGTLFGLLFFALCLVAWWRRDALSDRLCSRLAHDPRGWRDEGQTFLVSAEGLLFFDGFFYRVGIAFYNRRTTVQSSPLFLRVSASDVAPAVVVPRKFGLSALVRARSRLASAGFSLIESMAATALFAVVVVAVVFPTVVVLSRADQIAQQRETATQLAANALVDEQTALAYGSAQGEAAHVASIDGMVVTTTVAASAIQGASAVSVEVAQPDGTVLVRLATMVGPPVPPPGTPSPQGPAQ